MSYSFGLGKGGDGGAGFEAADFRKCAFFEFN